MERRGNLLDGGAVIAVFTEGRRRAPQDLEPSRGADFAAFAFGEPPAWAAPFGLGGRSRIARFHNTLDYSITRVLDYQIQSMRFSFTFLGHSTFLFRTARGKRVIVDPWLETNPMCPEPAKRVRELDLMLLTHGHRDHTADAVSLARATGAQVIAPYELSRWLEEKGLKRVTPMNAGGSLSLLDLAITMVPAVHSSSIEDDNLPSRYAGLASGYVVRFEHGPTIYYAGDTALFGDMRLIGELYRPSIAFLPIGDVYTMGPEHAATACAWLGVKTVVPMHYATFPELTGTPARLRELLSPAGAQVLELTPGETAE